jgi:hypothetical protein
VVACIGLRDDDLCVHEAAFILSLIFAQADRAVFQRVHRKKAAFAIDQNRRCRRAGSALEEVKSCKIIIPVGADDDQAAHGSGAERLQESLCDALRVSGAKKRRYGAVSQRDRAAGGFDIAKPRGSRAHPLYLLPHARFARLQKARHELPAGRDQPGFAAVFPGAFDHSRNFEVPGKAGGSHVGGADDHPALGAPELQDDLRVKRGVRSRAGHSVKAAGMTGQRGGTVKGKPEHVRIGDQKIIVAACAAQACKRHVLICVEVDAEACNDAGVEAFFGECLV